VRQWPPWLLTSSSTRSGPLCALTPRITVTAVTPRLLLRVVLLPARVSEPFWASPKRSPGGTQQPISQIPVHKMAYYGRRSGSDHAICCVPVFLFPVPLLPLHRTRTGSFEPDSICLRISVVRTRIIIAGEDSRGIPTQPEYLTCPSSTI
jgi:hypothetical protein